jgi:hypothetical protein
LQQFEGKHASSKAKMLMEAISSGQLFKVEAACALSENCTAMSSSIIPSVEAGKSW